MQILGVGGRFAKAGVVVGNEGGEEHIARGNSADLGKSQLLHKPVLQSLVGPRDPAFGLAGICAANLDLQPI